jgi:hypothetical protein
MKDFPAAHSMDSTWFAIDRDGHVAIFETGESGCMPVEGYGEQGMLHEDQLRALPATGQRYDLAGYRVMNGDRHIDVAQETYGDMVVLAFIRDIAEVRDLLPRLKATELAATSGTALFMNIPEREAFEELHKREQCSGCSRTWRDLVNDDNFAKHGLYIYDHTCENWISGPYARMGVPAAPVHVDTLPKEIRERASRFDGRWSDVVEIQPAEHWECGGWEPAWLAMDRKTVRPFADRAEEYAEAVENLSGDLGDEMGLVFVEPDED